jgi:hypothetical protein
MTVQEYISKQSPERAGILSAINDIIIATDKTVTAAVGPMMGKKMILYTCATFKYGLASVTGHLTLHLLPMYVKPAIHERYHALLPNATFQKGCINFSTAGEMPLSVVAELIKECAAVDLPAIRAEAGSPKKKKNG